MRSYRRTGAGSSHVRVGAGPSHVRHWALVAGLVVSTLGLPSSLLAQSGGQGQVGLPLGTQAPSAAVEDLEGNPIDLLDLVDGKPTLIEFWASWCELCEALQPQLDQVRATHGDAIRVVAVAVAVSQSQRRVRRHVEQHGAEYPFVWDGEGNAVRAYRAATTSVIVILDEEGRVAYTGVGADQDIVSAMASVVGG